MLRIIISTAMVLILLVPVMANASESANARAAQAQWGVSDKCNRNAIAKYPDHTSEALAKREQAVRQCNVANRLPARAPLTPAQPSQN
jgi:hypothetical protein